MSVVLPTPFGERELCVDSMSAHLTEQCIALFNFFYLLRAIGQTTIGGFRNIH
jgi:hypothetical protein